MPLAAHRALYALLCMRIPSGQAQALTLVKDRVSCLKTQRHRAGLVWTRESTLNRCGIGIAARKIATLACQLLTCQSKNDNWGDYPIM